MSCSNAGKYFAGKVHWQSASNLPTSYGLPYIIDCGRIDNWVMGLVARAD